MTIQKVHLRKLLTLFYAPLPLRTKVLRADIRNELNKQIGMGKGGGDFHTPFWTDAKNHAANSADLRQQTAIRIDKNSTRARLYPLLTEGFLTWWDEKRRWRNEPVQLVPKSVKGHLEFTDLGATVKVENLMSLQVGDMDERIIYPYFSEAPSLSPEAVRLGLWALSESLQDHDSNCLRLLDVLRANSFSLNDIPLLGNEQNIFETNYTKLLADWETLKQEYE